MAAKKAPKSPSKSPNVRPGKHGGTLRSGNPGNKGGGRPPDAFKELCRQYASGAMTDKGIGLILTDPDHPQYLPALKFVSEHGYGKAKESVDVTSNGNTVGSQAIVIGGRTIVF